jgi:mRNA interferase MazF
VRGSEADKTRPVVVVSNDASNAAVEITGRGVVTVVPVTSSVGRVFSFQVLLEPSDSGLEETSKAQPEQIRAVAVSRFVHRVGRLTPRAMWELDEAVALHLGLS